MMPTQSFRCFRCTLTLAPGTQYCPSCGTFQSAAPPDTVQGTAACLRTTDGHPVPLLGVALGGEVFGAHARVVLRQRYKNRETRPIEAVYSFPIPSDATLVGFAMECEGRRMEAEVKEREEAFAKYDEAIAKGHGAALLEQERPNVFTASVGNLLPGEETVVEVTFLQKLTADEGALRLMIPTLVAPKYIPGVPTGDRTGHGAAAPTHVVPDADRITPKIGDVRYGLAMDIVFDLGRDVTIESPSHAIRTTAEPGMRQHVTFASQTVALDRDIVLVAEGAPGVAAGLVCDKPAGEEGTFALTLVPDLFEAKKKSKGRAVVFVVDVSGSMAGDSIEQAKRALRLCLRHLGEGDLFDIVPFSSSYSCFSSAVSGARRGSDLVPFTQMTLKEADRYVDALSANGGTEMLAPLSAAATLLAGVKRDRIIVLLTDGQVGNEAQIVEEIVKQAAGARVYTFGIGTNVSDLLLRDLAKRTKGAVEFIHPGERIDEKVTAQFARATAARVDAVSVKWVGVDAGEVSPGDPPTLVDGEPWSMYGRYETAGMGRAEIRGTLGGEAFYMEVPLDLVSSANRPSLTSLWAGARVRDLEQVDAASLGRRAEAHKKRIVDLCVRHGIASKYTSFVVVEKRTGDRRAQGQPETRAVPVNAPAGWAMLGQPSVQVDMLRAAPQPAPQQMRSYAPMPRSASGGAPMPASSTRSRNAPSGGAPRGAPPPPPMAQGNFGLPPGSAGYGGPSAAAPAFAPPPMMAGPLSPMAAARAASPAEAAVERAQAPAPMAAPKESRSRSEESQSKGGGGLFERAKKALGLSKDETDRGVAKVAMPSSNSLMDAEDKSLSPNAMDSVASLPLEAPAGGAPAAEDLGGVFARQLASGLWESRDASDKGRLVATTEHLERCVREGVDTSHPVYGAQVAKAVDALCTLAETMALAGTADKEVGRALLAMAAVSTGKRARARLTAIATAAKSETVRSVAAHVSNQEAAKKRLAAG
jgi:Ca-activated chloride channel family protein